MECKMELAIRGLPVSSYMHHALFPSLSVLPGSTTHHEEQHADQSRHYYTAFSRSNGGSEGIVNVQAYTINYRAGESQPERRTRRWNTLISELSSHMMRNARQHAPLVSSLPHGVKRAI